MQKVCGKSEKSDVKVSCYLPTPIMQLLQLKPAEHFNFNSHGGILIKS